VLNILEFDSTRKRMSVIVKDDTGKIIMFTKVCVCGGGGGGVATGAQRGAHVQRLAHALIVVDAGTQRHARSACICEYCQSLISLALFDAFL
jgi:hypothetical protein